MVDIGMDHHHFSEGASVGPCAMESQNDSSAGMLEGAKLTRPAVDVEHRVVERWSEGAKTTPPAVDAIGVDRQLLQESWPFHRAMIHSPNRLSKINF